MCRPIYPLVVGLLVVILDITAGVLGIQAQNSQNSNNRVNAWSFECEASQAVFKKGINAIILVSIAHVVIKAFSCCNHMCSLASCRTKMSGLQKLSLVFLILAWLTFLAALVLLITGTYPNRPSRISCDVSRSPLLTLGGIGCFVHGVWCLGYCFCTTVEITRSRSNA